MTSWNSSRRALLARGMVFSAGAPLVAASAAGAERSANIDVVLAFCKAGEMRDVEAQMRFIPEDGVYHNMPDEPIKGAAGIRALLTSYITGTDASQIIVRNIAVAPSGTVLTERVDRFRIKDKWIDCPVMGAADVENGKIKVWRDYYDNLRLRAQMG